MTATPPLTVSVVIPVKDDAAVLIACLRALSLQSQRMLEIIVVDNGSTDASALVATRAGAVVIPELKRGIAAASGTGYDAARGDIIARVDADTVVPADWIETVMKEFDRRPDVDAVTGGAYFLDGPTWLRRPAALVYLGAYFFFAGLALSHVPVFGSNLAMRRQAWVDVRDEVHASEAVHDDFDLSYHLGRRHRIRFLVRLRPGISMRPLFDGKGRLRMRRGLHSVVLHWPEELPLLRFLRRLALRTQMR